MAYLGKGRKSDLSYIAEQLGERVIDDLKIIDLRNLIVTSTNYDEEFFREMINVRIEERLEESAEGYPLPVNDIPQAREIPQNTPYHDVFMSAMPSSRRGNTSPFSVGRFAPVFWIGFFTVIQSVFLIGLESAEGYSVPVNDIPQAREIPKNTPYHDVFMSAMPSSRRGNTSPFSVGSIAGLGITTFKQLKDLMITDQLKKKAPIEFKEHHLDEGSGIISPVDLARKIEEYEDVRKTFQKKVTWSYSKDTMKKKWNNSTIIPRENVSMNNPMNTREHKNGNNHQDFEKRRRPQCFECGSYDHFRPQCPKLKKYMALKP
ncbi:retrovirus-related Pol polyprotein from transposon 17.6 [Trichonephila clavipes]|nr:retrovirus-related Pol polyprotein from transposon 17.6 [Trichonephila clavipes]